MQFYFAASMLRRSIAFALPQKQVAQQAKLNLHYSFSPGLLTQLSHLNVLLNGALIASLPVPAKPPMLRMP